MFVETAPRPRFLVLLLGVTVVACGSSSIVFTAPFASSSSMATGSVAMGTGGAVVGTLVGGSSGGAPGAGGSAGSSGGSGGVDAGASPTEAGSTACNRDCPNAPCARLEAAWRTAVSGPSGDSISALAVSPDFLYFGTSTSSALVGGEIDRIPLAGGTTTMLVSNVQPRELLLDGDSLYYVDNITHGETSSLRVVPTSGGSHLTIASDSRLSNVRADADYLYYATSDATGAGRIVRIARPPAMSPPELVVDAPNPWGFAIDDASIYWTTYVDNVGTLFRRSLAGGEISILAKSSELIASPVVHGDDVYFFYGGTPEVCKGAVLRVARTGGAVEQVSPGTTGVASLFGGIALDGSYVYWSQIWAEDGWLLRAPIAGGSPELLETQQLVSGGVTATATDVYWVARASVSSTQYEIRAIEK